MATENWTYPSAYQITGTTYIKDTDNYIMSAMADLVNWVNSVGDYSLTGLAQSMVSIATAQTITGQKTFSAAIIANGGVTGDVTGDLTGNADTATALSAGSDRDKLDGIEAGATADQSAAEIMAAVQTLDTDDSGLNSNFLQGLTASQFLRSDAADIKTSGNLTFNDNVYLNMGTGNDFQMFTDGAHMYMDLKSGIGNLYIRDETTTRFTFDDAGHFTATGNITAYSDTRLKKDLQVLTGSLQRVMNITGYTFERTDTEMPRQTGVIAQDVISVLPEAVSKDEKGILSVNYGAMAGMFIEAIKELKSEVDELKAEINELKGVDNGNLPINDTE